MNRLGRAPAAAFMILALVAGACGSDEVTSSSQPVATTAQVEPATTTASPQTTVAPPQGETVTGERISAVVPPGWDVRIERTGTDSSGAASNALLHAANIALPATRGTFGGEVAARLGSGNVFVALVEAGRESVGRALYAPVGLPRNLDPQAFSPDAMERSLPGQAGLQRHFTEQGRPFTLYAVLGSHSDRDRLVPLVNGFLAGVTIRSLS